MVVKESSISVKVEKEVTVMWGYAQQAGDPLIPENIHLYKQCQGLKQLGRVLLKPVMGLLQLEIKLIGTDIRKACLK